MFRKFFLILAPFFLLSINEANCSVEKTNKKSFKPTKTQSIVIKNQPKYDSNYEHILSEEDKMLVRAIVLCNQSKWDQALDVAKQAKDSNYAVTIVTALKFYNSPANYSTADIKDFFLTNGWLPIEMFEKRIEKSFKYNTPYNEVISWFKFRAPKTDYGKLQFIHATIQSKQASLDDIEIQQTFRHYWRSTLLDNGSEQYFLNQYKNFITVKDFLKKIELLTWNKSFDQANILINLLPYKNQKLPKLRIKIIQNPQILSQVIHQERSIISDEIVKYHVINYLLENDENLALEKLLTFKPKNNFAKWWKLKHIAVRNALKVHKYNEAYILSAENQLDYGAEYAEAEWLSGWIAFRFLKENATAKLHFESLYNNTKLANSRSKAAYWLARVYEKEGDKVSAENWFEIASQFKGTFYGHLSLSYIKKDEKINYFVNNANIASTKAGENSKKITRLVYMLYKTNNKLLAHDFIDNLPYIDTDNHGLRYAAAYFNSKQLHPLAVEVGRSAVNKASMLVKEGYPSKLTISNNNLPKGLYLAIIRQESKFDPLALSPAGARGLMQIMPNTASRLAKTLGLPSDSYATSPKANVMKGVKYIDQLYSQYNNCILTIAAYNAGPGNVNKWLVRNGDPRKFTNNHQTLDWIESIPFAETRDYVKKVLENFVVYDSILSPQHTTQSIIAFMSS